MKLSEYIKQDSFASAGQEAMLNILVTASWIESEMAKVFEGYDVTPAQYNVLRILRGSHPEKLTCSEIGARLLDRTPDVTRLLNRLQKAGLVTRQRAEHDRRVVEVGITPRGLELLGEMQPEVDAAQERVMRHLDDAEHEQLGELLEQLRSDQTAE